VSFSAIVSVAQGSDVFFHPNLDDLAGSDWISLNGNKPWGNEAVLNVGVSGYPGNEKVCRAMVATASRVYFADMQVCGTFNPTTNTRDRRHDGHMGGRDGQPALGERRHPRRPDITSEGIRRILVAAGNGSNPTRIRTWGICPPQTVILAGAPATLPGAHADGGSLSRLDWDWRPVAASQGSDVFYTRADSSTTFTSIRRRQGPGAGPAARRCRHF